MSASACFSFTQSQYGYLCVCWEMINVGVLPNKYEIQESLAGLDWRKKCIISPWTHCSQGAINIIASAHPWRDSASLRDRGRDG